MKYKCAALFVLGSALCSVGAYALLRVPLKECLLFMAYQICLIYLPGIFAIDLLSGGKELKPFLYICAVFSAGYAATILEYFLLAAVGLGTLNARIISGCIPVLLFLLSKFRHCSVCIKKWDRGEAAFAMMFLFLLVIVFFSYSANYVLPSEERNSVRYHQDAMYWIETASALKISFPPQELRFSGIQFYYHYFASVYVAFASLVTGIHTFTLGYTLYPLTRCLLLFGGFYFLAETAFNNIRHKILFLICLLFATGNEYNSQARYVSQLIYLPFGFDIALGYGAATAALLLLQLKDKKTDPRLWICAAVSMLMCTGHKAPVGLVFMVFCGVVCFYWLIKKEYGKAFGNGIALVAVFTAVMVVCIGFLLPGENGVDAGTFGLNANLKKTWLYAWRDQYRFAQAVTLGDKCLSLVTEAAALLMMIFSFNPLMMFLDLHAVIRMRREKQPDPVNAALLAATAFGIFMGSFNEQPGLSQMYYSLAAFVPGLCLGLRTFRFEKKCFRTLCSAAAAILLILQIKWYFVDQSVFENVISNVSASVTDQLPQIEENDSDEFDYPLYSIQYEEYEAMLWIRDNTPEDCMIMPDKDVCKGAAKYLYYGTFSERQTYLEGTCYLSAFEDQIEERRQLVSRVYLNDPDALEKVKTDGVDYIIQTKWVIPTFEGNGCTLVFENDMVRIWQIDR